MMLAINLDLWRMPASAIMAAAFVLALIWLDRYHGASRVCRALTSMRVVAAETLFVVGCMAVEGWDARPAHHSWLFCVAILLLAAAAGLVALQRLRGLRSCADVRHNIASLCNHAGIFIVLWAAAFGAADVVEAKAVINRQSATCEAYRMNGRGYVLPFELQLTDFEIERYDDGTPMQFRSHFTCNGTPLAAEVNAPAHFAGWTIYQDGYDQQRGLYVVLLVVRDAWLWVVYVGIAIMLIGACAMIFGKR